MRHYLAMAFLPLALFTSAQSSAQPLPAADEPTIAKDSVQVTAYTAGSFEGNSDVWSWVPHVAFRVNGPIASGGVLSLEFKRPSGPWLTFDAPTEQTSKDHWWTVDAAGKDLPDAKGITETGTFEFAIHLRNELAKSDAVLFSGKFSVSKVHSNETVPKAAEHFVYYVDQDWDLPIGYVFLAPDNTQGWKLPTLNAAFWARGDPTAFEPHVFYKGAEIGKITFEGNPIGKASFTSDASDVPSKFIDDSLPQKATWTRIVCTFPNVKAWDQTGKVKPALANQVGARAYLKDNPGEYEIKVLRHGKLARSIKFTVGAGGKIDDSISTANKLGDNRAIVPVQVLDDQDGQWDHDAWKADAFYGNPLDGFAAP